MIIKGDNKEAVLLDRCLENVSPFVDGIFITSTYKKGEKPNKEVEKVVKKYNGNLSIFEWVNNFATARNFNFSQVTKDYDYILWCDADDVFRGLEKLKPTLEKHPEIDVAAFWYLYDFDEYKMPTVVHKKSQVVKNDGCVTWVGALHEDFKENRALTTQFIEGIDRMHLTTDERVRVAQMRNVEVSEQELNENPNDPRNYWNVGNSYLGAGMYDKAMESFEKFIKESQSHEEKYLARVRVAGILDASNKLEEAVENLWIAIGMKPDYPDAYLQIGQIFFKKNDLDMAEYYLLNGLVKKPPYHSIIVYNPRDYDYNPMMLLAKVYFNKNRPDLALPMLKGCLKIYPENKEVQALVTEMEVETKRLEEVLEFAKKLNELTDIDEIKEELDKVPKDLQSHPYISSIRNKHFIKTESSGKDLVYYCGQTMFDWNPDLFQTRGFGGSEEAVYNLSKEWAKAGWNVTVYNSCGTESMTRDGVTYRPFWEYNYRDKQDVTILWRAPRLADYELNSTKVFVDLHDVIPDGEFTEKRLKKIDKVFVKTKFHRSLFPSIPDEKIEIVPNGQDFSKFVEMKKDPNLIINTSSPDRSMDVMVKIFKRVKELYPQAKMKWAYGWENYDNAHKNDSKKMAWKDEVNQGMIESGIENLGRLTQADVAKLYCEASVFAYPTEFAEIDCISVKKAQAGGAIPVVTDFGALDESTQFGTKIHSKKTKDNWAKDYQFAYGLEGEKEQEEFAQAVVEQLKNPSVNRKEMMEWTKKFSWNIISQKWLNLLK